MLSHALILYGVIYTRQDSASTGRIIAIGTPMQFLF